MLAHFTRERQILATLQHPHIARLLDGGATPDGQPYLVMEYVEGEPIDAYCNDRALSLDARLRLFEEVCGAVQFAHQRLVVHCDLKPSNVLVRADGTPVLLDFGIARALDRQRARRARPKAGYFTPGYASPEQLQRRCGRRPRRDVYSLGLILFEIIAGRKARVDTVDRTIALLGDAAVQPSEIAEDVPWRGRIAGDLDAIVLRATAAEPSARYASAEALARDLRRHRETSTDDRARADAGVSSLRDCCADAGRCSPRRVDRSRLIAAFTWRLAAERDRALAAEREARVQATAAERVSAFLVSVFDVSNPRLNQKRDVSARDVLDEGAAAHPDRARRSAARQGEAARHARRRRIATSASPRRASSFSARASSCISIRASNEPLAAAAALSQLAVNYANNGYSRKDAEAAARRSLELRLKNGADPLDIGDAYNSLGIVLQTEDRLDEPKPRCRKGSSCAARTAPMRARSHRRCTTSAIVAADRDEFDAALADFREALDLREKTIGERTSGISAHAHELRRRRSAAPARAAMRCPCSQRSLAIARDLFGDDSGNTGAVHNELGSVLHDEGRFREAILHLSRSDAHRRAHRRRERRRAREAAQQSRFGVRGHGRLCDRGSAVPRIARDPPEDARRRTIRWCCARTTTSVAC